MYEQTLYKVVEPVKINTLKRLNKSKKWEYGYNKENDIVVLDKTGTRYARSATIINVIYAAVLFYFKELNDLPMSTTWVFVGLLCGRELAISTMNKDYKFKYVFPLIGKDFIKMIFGLSVYVGIVLAIHYIIIPNNWF